MIRYGLMLIVLMTTGLSIPRPGWTVEPMQRELAITFDDLPHVDFGNESSAIYRQRMIRLIDALRSNETPATGFVNEQRLYRNGKPDKLLVSILEAWLDSGLELGNHTFSHASLHALSIKAFEQEILEGEHLTRKLVEQRGGELNYFRHPFLHVGQDLTMRHDAEGVLKRLNYTVAPITINVNDWTYAAAYHKVGERGDTPLNERVQQAYLEHITEAIESAEKLSHEIFGRPIRHILGLHANALNADSFNRLAKLLQQRGYRFITLDEALQDDAYSSLDTYHGSQGESWLYHWAHSVGLNPVDRHRVPGFVTKLAGPLAYQ
jgi:peptidoglycan/xylan/chitin deacetylase (PgdA/CDA1 family)